MSLPWIVMSVLGGLLGLYALVYLGVALFMVWAHLREPRLVSPYAPRTERCTAEDPTGHAPRTAALAEEQGFTLLGWHPDAHAPRVDCCYLFLVSDDRTILANAGVGKVGRFSQALTWVQTFSADGREGWITSDKASGIGVDPLGLHHARFVNARDFADLLDQHRRWVAREMPGPAFEFLPGAEMRQLLEISKRHSDELVRASYIRFIDPANTRYTHTLRGALKVTYLTLRQIRSSVRENQKRRKPPGTPTA